ncbi:MAG: hypothetical protein QM736_29850 [Vicinamibacterales bacterium]
MRTPRMGARLRVHENASDDEFLRAVRPWVARACADYVRRETTRVLTSPDVDVEQGLAAIDAWVLRQPQIVDDLVAWFLECHRDGRGTERSH